MIYLNYQETVTMNARNDLTLQNIKRDMKDIETLTRLINEKLYSIKRKVSDLETKQMFTDLKFNGIRDE